MAYFCIKNTLNCHMRWVTIFAHAPIAPSNQDGFLSSTFEKYINLALPVRHHYLQYTSISFISLWKERQQQQW